MSYRNPSSSANLVGKNGVKPGATRGFFFLLSSLSFLLVCSLLVHSKKQQPVHKCGLWSLHFRAEHLVACLTCCHNSVREFHGPKNSHYSCLTFLISLASVGITVVVTCLYHKGQGIREGFPFALSAYHLVGGRLEGDSTAVVAHDSLINRPTDSPPKVQTKMIPWTNAWHVISGHDCIWCPWRRQDLVISTKNLPL